MRTYYILFFFILLPICSLGQKKKGYSMVYPVASLQRYSDVNSVQYFNSFPAPYLLPKNTWGHYFGLQYERVTKYGLVLTGGFAYGIRRYDVSIYQDVSTYDSTALVNLSGSVFNISNRLAVRYLDLRLQAGYRRSLGEKMAVVAKAGISMRNLFNGLWTDQEYRILYTNDSGVSVEGPLANIEMRFGRDTALANRGVLISTRFPNMFSFEFYIGVERKLNMSIIKNISIGIEGSRCTSFWPDLVEMSVVSFQSIDQTEFKRVNFFDRNLFLGLKVGLGLWR